MTQTAPIAIELNPAPQFERRVIGKEDNIVFIADNVLANPEALLELACDAPFGAPPPKSRYPGLVAPLPDAYVKMLRNELQYPMAHLFGLPGHVPMPVYGFFGLATVPAGDFVPAQTAPHTDATRLNSFASVHYLSHQSFGGTAFYRHKATGFELISPIRSDKFARVRREELAGAEGQPPSAVEDLYEEIDYVEPRFNRLVFYRAGQLHRSKLDSGALLTSDPRTGRLTANLFFNTEGM
jgi:hypothetical protein